MARPPRENRRVTRRISEVVDQQPYVFNKRLVAKGIAAIGASHLRFDSGGIPPFSTVAVVLNFSNVGPYDQRVVHVRTPAQKSYPIIEAYGEREGPSGWSGAPEGTLRVDHRYLSVEAVPFRSYTDGPKEANEYFNLTVDRALVLAINGSIQRAENVIFELRDESVEKGYGGCCPSPDIWRVGHYRNGLREGGWVSYYQSANVECRETYIGGCIEGQQLCWWDVDKGGGLRLDAAFSLATCAREGLTTAYCPDGSVQFIHDMWIDSYGNEAPKTVVEGDLYPDAARDCKGRGF